MPPDATQLTHHPFLGQIELYTHYNVFPTLVANLNRLGVRTCATYLIESQFMEDKYKFFRYVWCIKVLSSLKTVGIKLRDKVN